jgi:hypothetical protein
MGLKDNGHLRFMELNIQVVKRNLKILIQQTIILIHQITTIGFIIYIQVFRHYSDIAHHNKQQNKDKQCKKKKQYLKAY